MPEGTRVIMPDSPLMREMSDVTIGELLVLTHNIMSMVDVDSEDFNEKTAQVTASVRDQCLNLDDGEDEDVGAKAMARSLHVALNLITTVLYIIKETAGITELREELF